MGKLNGDVGGTALTPAQIYSTYQRMGLATAADRAMYAAPIEPQTPVVFDVVISTTSEPFDD